MRKIPAFIFLFTLLVAPFLAPAPSRAQNIGEIRNQLENINRERQKIDEEIAEYQRQLQAIGAEKQTLQTALGALDLSRSQTQAQISSIQKKISAANLQLNELAFEIKDTETSIALDRATLGESIRSMHMMSESSIIEQLLSVEDFADAWVVADQRAALNGALRTHAVTLAQAKEDLSAQQESVNVTKTGLARNNDDLVSQRIALDINRQEKQSLLTETQASEAAYQSLLAKKQQERAAVEQELSALEESLRVAIDPSSVPSAGSGVLSWPIDSPLVTQGYGLTAFARSGAYGYDASGKPKPHTGIDFGVPTGTPVRAALSGTVRGWGNTDAVKGCYSFGKWILIDHANGLSTAYLHLSHIAVEKGDEVKTGEVIGNSGNTGYSTGPHLHFGVYAKQGVEMMNLGAWYTQNGQTPTTACAKGGAIIPVAPKEAYLDPTDYL